MEENLTSIRNSKEYLELNLSNKIYELTKQKRHIINVAKVYILDNYSKVTDYSNLFLKFIENGVAIRYGKKDKLFDFPKNKIENIFNVLVKDVIEIESITNVILDHEDFDLSLDINGKPYWWLDDDYVLEIAYYIENNLK